IRVKGRRRLERKRVARVAPWRRGSGAAYSGAMKRMQRSLVLGPVPLLLLAAAAPAGEPAPSAGAAAVASREAGAARAAGTFATPPVLAAADVLPAALLKGPHHRVLPEVSSDGYMEHFRIESDFGPFTAAGRRLLAVRVREIAAIAQLEETSKTKVFLESAGKAAMKPVTSAAKLVEDPAGTVKGIPGGVSRAFGRLKRTASSAGGAAKDAVDGDDGKEKEGAAADTRSNGDKAQDLAKSWLGISAAHRKWAQKLGVDPYSSNAVLREKLDGVAKVDR